MDQRDGETEKEREDEPRARSGPTGRDEAAGRNEAAGQNQVAGQDRPEGQDRPDGQDPSDGQGQSAASGESALRKVQEGQKDRITEHVIGHVIGGAIVGVMAWFWTQTPVGFVMTVIWGVGVYWWNKSPLVQGWPKRRRIRLGVAITATYWLFAFLVM